MTKRRLYYVPGLINLIGLPILFFVFKPKDDLRLYVQRLRLPSDDTINTESFSKAFIDSFIKTKKIEQIYLDSYAESEFLRNRQLYFIEKEVQRIQFTHDTSMILQIKLGTTGTFGNFVTFVNIAYLYNVRRFVLYDDQFYFYANDPPPIIEPPITTLYIDQEFRGPEFQGPSKWKIFYWDMKYRLEAVWFDVKQNVLLSSGFLILIIIPALYHLIIKRR